MAIGVSLDGEDEGIEVVEDAVALEDPQDRQVPPGLQVQVVVRMVQEALEAWVVVKEAQEVWVEAKVGHYRYPLHLSPLHQSRRAR